jgi:hypothetical protein
VVSARKGLNELDAALDISPEKAVKQQVVTAKKGILASAQDARREAQRVMAQRGLSNSSLGLASNRSITQQQGKDIANVNASMPEQIRQMKLQNAQTRISAGQGMFGAMGGTNGVQMTDVAAKRSGGVLGIAGSLAPIAGSVVGGIYGGPMGAAAGNAAGQGISQAINQAQG